MASPPPPPPPRATASPSAATTTPAHAAATPTATNDVFLAVFGAAVFPSADARNEALEEA